MTTRKLLSIGFEFPGGEVPSVQLSSNRSVLDADILIFQPGINYRTEETYQGKPLLDENDSFRIVEQAKHWRDELETALGEGKTIFVILSRLEQVYIYTDKQDASNQRITKYVTDFDNYRHIPHKFTRIVPRSGESIRATPDIGVLANYWKDFAPYSSYETYVEGTFNKVLLTTKTGGKVVGAMNRSGKGTIIFLPSLNVKTSPFARYDSRRYRHVWTKEGKALGQRLISTLVGIDKALRASLVVAPVPAWVEGPQYRLARELAIESEIRNASDKIEELRRNVQELSNQLEEEGKLRRLIYAQGTELEASVLDALRLLGFAAEPYENTESEFDVIFLSPEGRFLGEAEGKDNRAIDVDKFRQLVTNLQEDYERDDVSDYAKGVLFGNAHRLTDPNERPEYFTTKCVTSARRYKVALVRTPDLFPVAKYLKETPDPQFAEICRKAIHAAEGEVVVFPEPPSS